MMWQEMIGSGSLRSMRADKLPSGAVRQVLQESGGPGQRATTVKEREEKRRPGTRPDETKAKDCLLGHRLTFVAGDGGHERCSDPG